MHEYGHIGIIFLLVCLAIWGVGCQMGDQKNQIADDILEGNMKILAYDQNIPEKTMTATFGLG